MLVVRYRDHNKLRQIAQKRPGGVSQQLPQAAAAADSFSFLFLFFSCHSVLALVLFSGRPDRLIDFGLSVFSCFVRRCSPRRSRPCPTKCSAPSTRVSSRTWSTRRGRTLRSVASTSLSWTHCARYVGWTLDQSRSNTLCMSVGMSQEKGRKKGKKEKKKEMRTKGERKENDRKCGETASRREQWKKEEKKELAPTSMAGSKWAHYKAVSPYDSCLPQPHCTLPDGRRLAHTLSASKCSHTDYNATRYGIKN